MEIVRLTVDGEDEDLEFARAPRGWGLQLE
jgi:hypothetical protein